MPAPINVLKCHRFPNRILQAGRNIKKGHVVDRETSISGKVRFVASLIKGAG